MEVLKDTKEEVYSKLLTHKLIVHTEPKLKLVSVHWCPSLARVLPAAFCLNVCMLENTKDAFHF